MTTLRVFYYFEITASLFCWSVKDEPYKIEKLNNFQYNTFARRAICLTQIFSTQLILQVSIYTILKRLLTNWINPLGWSTTNYQFSWLDITAWCIWVPLWTKKIVNWQAEKGTRRHANSLYIFSLVCCHSKRRHISSHKAPKRVIVRQGVKLFKLQRSLNQTYRAVLIYSKSLCQQH